MKKLLIVLLPLLFAVQALALFEARVGYGVNTPEEDNLSNGSSLSTMKGFNLDGIVELPLVPFGFGLRYESMGLDVQSGTATSSTDMTRLSLLVNYRIIDFFTYFGVIGTIGLSNDVTVKAGAPIGDIKYSADLTYSVGVEGGLSFGLIMVGAELGYNVAKYENSSATPNNVPFDGVYAKALVGVGF